MKTEAQYKEEFNGLVGGALFGLKRALYCRKQLAKLKSGSKHASGPVFVALSAIVTSLEKVKTYKGSFERNPGTPTPAPTRRR